MARWLLDTNLLLRSIERSSAHFEEAGQAMDRLAADGDILCVTGQVIVEFWGVATRPSEANGLGWEPAAVASEVDSVLSRFTLLRETADVFPTWLELVRAHERKGKQVHDARLVAVMKAHSVENLLTFNVEDFAAYDEIKAVHPRDVT